MGLKQLVAAEEGAHVHLLGAVQSGNGGQRGDDRIEVFHHPGFAATERGETERHQRELQAPEVVSAQCQVMSQVLRTRQVGGTLGREGLAHGQCEFACARTARRGAVLLGP